MRFIINVIAGLALMGEVAIAHPGHNVAEEAAERRDFLQSAKRTSLAHCADKLKARGVHARNTARRAAQIEKAREKRGLKKRDLDTVLDTSHSETDQGYTVNTDADTLFAGINSCVLTPEVTQGPYYVAGEYVRESLVEDQGGLDITLDYQVIDVDTCDPIPDVYVEMWHCNATGVYSGIIASGNGDSTDETNIDNTWLRGIQLTDEDGVAQFKSVFPGHYSGRTTHIHILVHTNDATLLANDTLGTQNYASHVGQAFFDQDLITEVELLAPYNTNTQDLTTNEDDSIMSEEAAGEVDPVMEYTLLGDDVSDGLFAWLAFGINSTLSKTINPAAFLYEEGGVANDNSGSGSGGGSGGPGGDSSGNGGSGGNPTTAEVVPTTTDAENSSSTSSADAASTNGVGRKGYDATVMLGCIGAAMVAL